jgi:hypothetical protein
MFGAASWNLHPDKFVTLALARNAPVRDPLQAMRHVEGSPPYTPPYAPPLS